MTHELIHMYDNCRGQVDWTDIHQLACTEIRAASLSGDCKFFNEVVDRMNIGFKAQHQKCVRRRAGLSMQAARGVTAEVAAKAVDHVFAPCFADTTPFDRIP
eukprot:m.55509 g.55509  ORF g.55509 m.55509 type:complete len:102 (+) comp48885_c0_seq2:503-808(+)